MVPVESSGTVSYSHFIATMAVSIAVCVKEWRDLENWVRGCWRSLKMALFDRPRMTSYRLAIVSVALSCIIFELFRVV